MASGNESRAFVAIDEGIVAGNPESVSRSQIGKIRLADLGEFEHVHENAEGYYFRKIVPSGAGLEQFRGRTPRLKSLQQRGTCCIQPLFERQRG